MQNQKIDLLNDVANYYTTQLAKHGETPKGVDWNGEESQTLRFIQLCKIINDNNDFTLNDLGCGYGALYDFLAEKYNNFSYVGIDISKNMIQSAKHRYADIQQIQFYHSNKPKQSADYGIASGIFNVRLNKSESEWFEYLEDTLDLLNESSLKGFAFNCLTSFSDADKMRNDLFYANPSDLFNLCKQRYAKNVALLHDYGLYEFTILVRKQL